MMDAQQTAFRLHKLDGLARLHLGTQAAVSFSATSDTFAVEAGGQTFARGTFENVLEAITTGKETTE